jgi:hypothetical protein
MKYFLILLTVLLYSTARSQTAEDSVRMAVNKMFAGMKNADAALLKNSFADSAILQTIAQSKEGNFMVKNEGIAEFIDFVSKQSPGTADERISFETIKVDGPLAIA